MKNQSKILKLVMVFVLILFLVSCDENGGGEFEIKTDDLTMTTENLEFLNLDEDIKFDANALLTELKRDEFILMLYLNSKEGDVPLNIDQSNIAAFLKHGNNHYYGEIEITPINQSGRNISVSIVMDYSSSMNENISYLQDAVKEFVNNFQPGDMGEIIKFGSTIDLIQSFTDDKDLLSQAIYKNSQERGGTALLSAINNGLNNLSTYSPNNSNALVAFTDGGDNASNISSDELIKNANQRKIPIFNVNLITTDNSYDLLKHISNNTGAFIYQTPDRANLRELYQRINTSIRNSYIVRVKWNKEKIPASGTNCDFILKVKDNDKIITELYKNINIP